MEPDKQPDKSQASGFAEPTDSGKEQPEIKLKTGSAEEPQPKNLVSAAELLASSCSRIILGLLLFSGFLIGFWVAGTALHDPDTCWLLALGRYIIENHQLPATDPFSWTFAAEEAAGQRFVLYQWLSEVVFYASTLPAGLVTLLLLCAVTISTAFLSIPMSLVVRRDAPFVKAALVVILGLCAASFHTLARPEIFSYLFTALYLQVLHDARVSCLTGEKKIFQTVFVLAPLMVLWANMHTGFITGFAVTGAVALGCGLSIVLNRAPVKPLFISALVSLLGCFIAALCNPYQFGLYAYIPKLFNASFNKYIVELMPVIGPNLNISWDLWPFVTLCLLYLLLLARESLAFVKPSSVKPAASPDGNEAEAKGETEVQAVGPFDRKLLATELVIIMLTGMIGIYNGLVHRRVASFVTLALVGEVIALLGLGQRRKTCMRAAGQAKPRFWPLLDAHSLDLWKAGGIYEMAIVALCALAGVTLVSFRISKPELPAGSRVFKPPFKAVNYIAAHAPEGKLYNDQQFGDMLIYYLKGKPKVFIDTRFDMYGGRFVEQYQSIHEAEPGWQEKLRQLGIDWVFLLPDSPLAIELKKDPGWQQLYLDEEALIMQRSK